MANTNNFDIYLNKVEALLNKSIKQKNSGVWLYQNDLRTPMFMLEALSKLYANLLSKKKFTKHKERYKRLEDLLGACNYYDSFTKQFESNKKISNEIKDFFKLKYSDCIVALNLELELEGWLPKNYRIEKIRKKLSEVEWLAEEDEIFEFYNYYKTEIYDLNVKVNSNEFNFSDVEIHLHELRRKLRWLSIYAQALQGSVQLIDTKPKDKNLSKYLTPNIVSSKFNVMPDAGQKSNFLILEKSYFHALSWVIFELGILKDDGLKVIALRDAIKVTENMSTDLAFAKACKILGVKQTIIKEILDKGKIICERYLKEKNLEKMLLYTANSNE